MSNWQKDEQQERLLETQTDQMASSLHDKVNRIKQVTIQMQSSMNNEQQVFDDVGTSFDSISSGMKRTTVKLGMVLNSPKGKRILYIIGGIISTFVLYLFLA